MRFFDCDFKKRVLSMRGFNKDRFLAQKVFCMLKIYLASFWAKFLKSVF